VTAYHRPTTLDEALALRQEHPDFSILAGGTDLMVAANQKDAPIGIIDIFGLEPLVGVRAIDGGGVRIGAATTYREIINSELARERLPILVAASREVGALQIQARGTIGGNIANSSPVGDTLPVLLALDARIALHSAGGRREVAYSDFCTGYRTTAVGPDEIIVAIEFPAQELGTVQYWRKVGTRKAQSISKVMVAATARVNSGVIHGLRIGVGAVAAVPIRARAAEMAGEGMAVSEATADAVHDAMKAEITPIDDVRSTAAYRAQVAGNLLRRFVLSLVT